MVNDSLEIYIAAASLNGDDASFKEGALEAISYIAKPKMESVGMPQDLLEEAIPVKAYVCELGGGTRDYANSADEPCRCHHATKKGIHDGPGCWTLASCPE